jgi:hypothetical protein
MKKIVLFGAGSNAKRLLKRGCKPGSEIVAVLDNDSNKWGSHILDYEIFNPQILLDDNLDYDVIIQTVEKDYVSIYEQLYAIGVRKQIISITQLWSAPYMDVSLDDYFYNEKKEIIPFRKCPISKPLSPCGGETAKSHRRHVREGFFDKYCQGEGLDIGCGADPIVDGCSGWDMVNGDAQYLASIPDESFDFVYSSHCLEHMVDVRVALANWFRVIRPGGYLLLYIPHRDLYEKRRRLPSQWNPDHKHFFLLGQAEAPDTLDIVEEIRESLSNFDLRYVKVCDEGHTIDNPCVHSDGEYSIEAVIKKCR